MSGRLAAAPIDFSDAVAFVREHHRHHTPPQGHKFSIAAYAGTELVGVVIVGRPVSRHRDDGKTLEVTRLCTIGHRNACSFLYGAAARAAFALGYQRIGTYILKREPGTTLAAAGWKMISETPGRSWSVPSRPREDKHPTEPKLLFERTAP
ncbi:XF1762 family protein [Novosphingobium sp. BL-8H]|uniref:XF1762 family protein n=1 Tax=Novosphingobium sp. BL-8H TaxID=3127640 RepID=UPI00375768B0